MAITANQREALLGRHTQPILRLRLLGREVCPAYLLLPDSRLESGGAKKGWNVGSLRTSQTGLKGACGRGQRHPRARAGWVWGPAQPYTAASGSWGSLARWQPRAHPGKHRHLRARTSQSWQHEAEAALGAPAATLPSSPTRPGIMCTTSQPPVLCRLLLLQDAIPSTCTHPRTGLLPHCTAVTWADCGPAQLNQPECSLHLPRKGGVHPGGKSSRGSQLHDTQREQAAPVPTSSSTSHA